MADEVRVGEIFCLIDPEKMKIRIDPEVAERFHARIYGIGDVVDDNPAASFKDDDK